MLDKKDYEAIIDYLYLKPFSKTDLNFKDLNCFYKLIAHKYQELQTKIQKMCKITNFNINSKLKK